MSTQDNNPPTDDAPPPKPAVNVAVQYSVQLEMLRLLREISRDRQGGLGDHNGSNGRGERNGGRSRIHKTLDNASFGQRQTDLNYWTHDGCNHASSNCSRKANGHKDAATKANHMGGSNAFCEWRGERGDDKCINDKLKNVFNNKFILSHYVVSPKPAPHINEWCVPVTLPISKKGVDIEPLRSHLPIVKTTPPPGFASLPAILPTHEKILNTSPSIEVVNILHPLPPSDKNIMVKGDSASRHHYWRQEDRKVLKNIQDSSRPSVLLPSGNLISSTQLGVLPLSSQLITNASTATILPNLKSASLISIGQLCDDSCEVYLNKSTLQAI